MLRFFRFSILTLVLATVCAGSALGCWLKPIQWKLARRITVDCLHHQPPDRKRLALAFSHGGDKVLCFDEEAGGWRIFDIATGALVRFIPLENQLYLFMPFLVQFNKIDNDVEIKPLSRLAASAGESSDELVEIERTLTAVTGGYVDPKFWFHTLPARGQFETDFCVMRSVYRIGSLAPGGDEYAVSDSVLPSQASGIVPPYATQWVHTYDIHTGQKRFSIDNRVPTYAARYSYDGKYLGLLGEGSLSIWKRDPEPGLMGILKLPYLWVGTAAALGLLAIFILNVRDAWAMRRRPCPVIPIRIPI